MDSLAHFNPDNLLRIFCIFDDLIMTIIPKQNPAVGRPATLSLSDIATISLLKSSYGIRELKQLYRLLTDRFSLEFKLPCYKNFVVAMNNATPSLFLLIHILLSFKNKQAGVVKLVDSTSIPVCKNMRIPTHKVMKRLATRSRTTTGWFYGLKLHAVSDHNGNLLKIIFSTANVDDRKALNIFLEMLSNTLVVADAGYTSAKLEKKALINNNFLLTGVRKNMKRIATKLHIFLLNQRIRIEQLFNVLKERYGLITSLPRSENGYLAHYIRVLFGYLFLPIIS